jgi:hypothetical protein
MMHLPRPRLLALAAALLALAAGRAEAQYQRYGFVAAGRGEAVDSYYEAGFNLTAGYLARFGPPVGAYIGVRTPIAWSRFTPDAEALADSLGVPSAEVEGGSAAVVESGIELVAGYETGVLGGYFWYGIHYLSETRNEITVNGQTIAQRNRSDLGPGYGAGVLFRVSPRVAAFTEWYRSGGFDDQMLRVEGLRVGVTGQF